VLASHDLHNHFQEAHRAMMPLSPNLALQRAGTDKLLGRGRPSPEHGLAPRARVLMRRRAVAELGSYAASERPRSFWS
jgi:hypothetical protein